MTISSLSSILSSYGYSTTTTTDSSAAVTKALEKLAGQSTAKTETVTPSSGTQVTISLAALAAAAAQEDKEKDFGALAAEVRASLDSQYAAGTGKGEADLSALSGRALAAMALNEGGQFSSLEQRAAKNLLREQTRESFASAMSQGSGSSAIASFSSLLATQYDSMSPEERQARGWSEQFRDTNASFAAQSSSDSSSSISSLFDMM